MNVSGIYKITNMITGKHYVGGSINFRTRWNKHFAELKLNKHHSKKLQNSVNKWGVENFRVFIIEWCSKEFLTEREQHWIDFYDACKNGYNTLPFARRPTGVVVSEETRRKRSESLKGHSSSDTVKQAVAKANSQRIWSEESRKKASDSKIGLGKGIPKSEAHKAKLRKPKSEEHKAKVRKPKSEDHKQKLKEAWILRKQKSELLKQNT